jgi:hypothetical protein
VSLGVWLLMVMSETSHPVSKHHIPEDLNFQYSAFYAQRTLLLENFFVIYVRIGVTHILIYSAINRDNYHFIFPFCDLIS